MPPDASIAPKRRRCRATPEARTPARDLYGANAVKGIARGISLFDWGRHLLVPTCFFLGAGRSGGQGWPKAIAQRLALDGRDHSAKLAQSGRHGCRAPARSGRQRRRYRGELAIGRASRATNLYSADPRVDTTMQSCASAAKLRGGGPILNRGAKAIVQHRVAAASVRHLQPSVSATLGCSNSMALTAPGGAADPPASRPWSRAATTR